MQTEINSSNDKVYMYVYITITITDNHFSKQ